MTLNASWEDGDEVHGSDLNAIDAAVNADTAVVTAIEAVNGLIKGNGSGEFSAAVAGTDYVAPSLGAIRPLSIAENGVGTGLSTATTTDTSGTSEHFFTTAMSATGLSAEFINWATDTTEPDADTDNSGSISFNASLRIVSTNTIYRFTFNGLTTATLNPGGRVLSDPIGIIVPAAAQVAIRTYLSSGTAYPLRSTYATNTVAPAYGGFTSGSDLTAPGSAAITSGTGYNYGPAHLLGYPGSTAAKPSVLIVGDSMARGVGDGTLGGSNGYLGAGADSISNGGYLLRALQGNAGVVNIAAGGDSANAFVTANGSFRRLGLANRCSSAIIQYGANDLGGQSQTAAQLEANLLAIATSLAQVGIGKVFVVTITPNTTSTDGWATTTNQTPSSYNTARITHNTWVRAGCPINPTTLAPVATGTSGALLVGQTGHPFTGFFDVANEVESSLNSGLWKACNRSVTDAGLTVSSYAINSATADFNSAALESGGDKGSAYWLAGAGAGGTGFQDWIGFINSSTQAVATDNNSTTVSEAALHIGINTIDGLHPSTNGHYLASQAINPALL